METTAVQNESKLKEFFLDQLQYIYWAERKLVKTPPKLQEAATTKPLKYAFQRSLHSNVKSHSSPEKVFGMIGKDVDSIKCQAMAGIVGEGIIMILMGVAPSMMSA